MTVSIPAASLQKAITYYYLLSYCRPEKISDFRKSTATLRKQMAEDAGLKEAAFFRQALPEVCRRIVAYHQATREPDPKLVSELESTARGAEKNAGAARVFQEKMAQVSTLPGRARQENRLHRNKGCRLCAAACRYGYFTLVSEPQLQQLRELLIQESSFAPSEQTPLRPAYRFATGHLLGLTGTKQGYYDIAHVANLAYCLLMLGIAKSRLALPEAQLQIFQDANQKFIRG